MRLTRLCLGVSSALFFATIANASDFANCSLANEQVKRLNEGVTNDTRIRAAESLMADLDVLRPNLVHNTSGYPDKLVKVCYNQKRNAMESIFINGNAALLGSFDFLMTAGRYFFYEHSWEAAYKAFEQAAKMQPRMIEPNYYALQAWNVWQLSTERTVGEAAYLRQIRKYVEAMKKSKDMKKEFNEVLAEYSAKFDDETSLVYSARKQFEAAAKLDQTSLKLRLNWGIFEEGAGRFDAAKSIYESALAIVSKDKLNQKDITLRLLRIYKLQGLQKQFHDRVQIARTQFPKDKDFVTLSIAKFSESPATEK